MKIAQVNAYHVRPRWGFVEIITDDGLSGWGEAVLEGHTDTVLECVHEMTEYLIGKDPGLIEDIWTTLYRAGFYRGGGVLMSAIAGIDQALWDIKGKHFNAPVNELIGGRCRDRIRVYSWIGGDRPSEVAEAARQKQKEGFTAIKMNATSELQFLDSYAKIDAAVERVASIREACGRDFGIAVDFHGRVHKPMAKILAKKLEEFDPMFIEEPVLCENMEYFGEIAACCNIPIATGERLYTRYDYKRLFKAGGVDIIQPDLSHAGGITGSATNSGFESTEDFTIGVIDSENHGDVTGTGYNVCGIGYIGADVTFSGCRNYGAITGDTAYGIANTNAGNLSDCENHGTVTQL